MFITKRDGRSVEFDQSKIYKAICGANNEITDEKKKLSEPQIAQIVEKIVHKVASNPKQWHVEEIQDAVELEICKVNPLVGKRYIVYRFQHGKIRDAKNTLVNYRDIVDKYLKVEDWRVKENATVTYSVGGLILSNSGAVTANYWLSEIYDEEIANAHRNADIHIHDLSMLSGYCAGWSLKQLI